MMHIGVLRRITRDQRLKDQGLTGALLIIQKGCCKCDGMKQSGYIAIILLVIFFWPLAFIPCLMEDCFEVRPAGPKFSCELVEQDCVLLLKRIVTLCLQNARDAMSV